VLRTGVGFFGLAWRISKRAVRRIFANPESFRMLYRAARRSVGKKGPPAAACAGPKGVRKVCLALYVERHRRHIGGMMETGLTPELTVLALAGLLQVLQILLMAVPANRQLGTAYTAGPRDEKREPTGVPGRLYRAANNHFEGLILFTVAVVVVTLGGQGSAVTAACAWIYLGARVLYIPAYAFGISYLRSIIWAAGFLATAVMLAAALV
jgi:uncharacterized MAPEG superfamily protein